MVNTTATTPIEYKNIPALIVPPMTIQGIQGKRTPFTFPDAARHWGYFNQVTDLKAALLLKGIFAMGRGWTCDSDTTTTIDHIRGRGKSTFFDILFDMVVTMHIYGSAFAEIIRDGEQILNLKVLDVACMTVWADDYGMIDEYEYKVNGESVFYKPHEIFHLNHNALSSSIIGISDIAALERVILANYRSFVNVEQVIQNQAKPFVIFNLDLDDPSKLATHSQTIRDARQYGNDIIFAGGDSEKMNYQVVQVNPSSILLQWRDYLRNDFFRGVLLPQVVIGAGGQSTESESKTIVYVAETIFSYHQKFLEGQIWNQLQLKINLIPPSNMQDMMLSDASKDANNVLNFQPSDFNAATGR